MSEEQKQQAARIMTLADALDARGKEMALAYMQGMTAGAKLMEAEKKEK